MASGVEQRAASFFTRPLDENPLTVPSRARGLETLGPGAGTATEVPFSVFIPAHQQKALSVAAELMHIANANPGDEGLEKVLDRAEEEAQRSGIELAQFALSVFITHHPQGRKLPIPRLEDSNPELVKPSKPVTDEGLVELGATGVEKELDWYREDASANDHHLRWHRVYPGGGHPDPNDPDGFRTADRQGELFLYMHKQMLARYDTERLAIGLGKAEPLSDYRTEVPEGYEPTLPPFDDRRASSLLTDSTYGGASVADLEAWDGEIFGEILNNDAAAFAPVGKHTTPDLIGCTVESNADAVDTDRFGDLHNSGHMIIAMVPSGNGGQQFGGVMRSVRVAIRDPIFYRWHRHVDDAHATWQDRQPAQSFDDAPTGVSVSGVIVCRAAQISGDAQQFGEQHFGGGNFATDPAASGVTTDTLNTFMRTRTINGTPVTFLDHDDFTTFIRATNSTGAEKTVTVRVFLVAEEWVEDRRRWIELDKFQHALAAGQSVIARSSKLSSVIRKPARRPNEPAPIHDPAESVDYCDCGWPYHLLLPRGKAGTGMKFRLLVMFSDWEIDKVEIAGKCSSMSFCGKMDSDYPDRRPMGYPFDRNWPDGKIAATIAAQPAMSARDLLIQWIDPVGP